MHLAGRFVGAHRPGGATPADREWVASLLQPGELDLWRRQPGHDRRHTAEVARRVEAALSGTAYAGDPRWLAAALLHDVGKLDSEPGIYGRVLATLAGKVAGGRLEDWEARGGLRRRFARYRRHDEIGAEMIRAAGGRAEAAHWAAGHHHRFPVDPAVVPGPVAEALAEADTD